MRKQDQRSQDAASRLQECATDRRVQLSERPRSQEPPANRGGPDEASGNPGRRQTQRCRVVESTPALEMRLNSSKSSRDGSANGRATRATRKPRRAGRNVRQPGARTVLRRKTAEQFGTSACSVPGRWTVIRPPQGQRAVRSRTSARRTRPVSCKSAPKAVGYSSASDADHRSHPQTEAHPTKRQATRGEDRPSS